MTDILHATPGNPLPPSFFAGYFRAFDGRKMRYAVFRSGSDVPKGTIVLLQGRNESIEKYFETITDLNAMGLWVATFDWRGQGGSARLLKNSRRGHVRRFSDLERDLNTFIETVVLPDAKLPFFILAHSMGALVALKSATRLTNRIERMVLSAPFVGGRGYGVPLWLLKFLAKAATLTGFGWAQFIKDTLRDRKFEGNNLTSDRIRFERNQTIVKEFPELGLGPPTARWIAVMMDTIERVVTMDFLRKIEIPCLVLAPSNDEVVPYHYFEEFSRKFRAGKLITISGAMHELFNERDVFRAQALSAIEAFIPGSDAEPMVFTES
jgi:lysophospholipase